MKSEYRYGHNFSIRKSEILRILLSKCALTASIIRVIILMLAYRLTMTPHCRPSAASGLRPTPPYLAGSLADGVWLLFPPHQHDHCPRALRRVMHPQERG